MKRILAATFLCFAIIPVCVQASTDVVCSYAPSQSKAVIGATGVAGGSSAAILAMAQATGLSVVVHSSGAYILTGTGGYIAGTLGTAAIAGPVIVGVGLVVGGAAVTVELLCAPINHPDQVAKIEAAAEEFARRSHGMIGRAKSGADPHVTRVSIAIKQLTGDVIEYAYRRDR